MVSENGGDKEMRNKACFEVDNLFTSESMPFNSFFYLSLELRHFMKSHLLVFVESRNTPQDGGISLPLSLNNFEALLRICVVHLGNF